MTPATIMYKHNKNFPEDTDTFECICVNSDGYPDHVGVILVNHYNTDSAILTFLCQGDLSGFNRDGSFEAYARDRGEDWEEVHTIIFDGENGYREAINYYGSPYVYIFADGKWSAFEADGITPVDIPNKD